MFPPRSLMQGGTNVPAKGFVSEEAEMVRERHRFCVAPKYVGGHWFRAAFALRVADFTTRPGLRRSDQVHAKHNFSLASPLATFPPLFPEGYVRARRAGKGFQYISISVRTREGTASAGKTLRFWRLPCLCLDSFRCCRPHFPVPASLLTVHTLGVR